ncbi:hypothetical protein BgAZ_110910 [Babesia gibsoni]|uniref:ATPase AAA-type core domain-containing protein n=1 Tax=Babesia gibsoni TaxID=33632 RepID=A0AAD8PGQ0_BABGI|nr:hypothetical protein BgAZ_110910 [Babesia gibsoni]
MEIEGLTISGNRRNFALGLEQCKVPGERKDHEPAPEKQDNTLRLHYWFFEAPTDKNLTSYAIESTEIKELILDSSYETLSSTLLRKLFDWKSKISKYGICSYDKQCSSILGVIRDSIFARILNAEDELVTKERVCGFWVVCYDVSEAFDLCLRISRSAFWFSGMQHELDRRIYSIDISEYESASTQNLAYSGSRYVSCCCRVCRDICRRLREDHAMTGTSSYKYILYVILSEHTHSLLTFLDHNRHYRNLEHQLLAISMDGYLSKQRIGEQVSRMKTGKKPVDGVLDDCGCFLILENIKSPFCSLPEKKICLNSWAVTTDLLKEYTSLWVSHDFPIHMFCIYDMDPMELSYENQIDGDDMEKAANVDYAEYLLSKLRCFNYHVDLTVDSGGDDERRERYLAQRLKLEETGDAETTIRYLVSLTNGYDIKRLEVVTRMAYCEYMAELVRNGKDLDSCHSCIFSDSAITARCFEKAVSLTPPVTGPVGMPGLCIIPYSRQNDAASVSSFPPLHLNDDGSVEIVKGFNSLVLCEQLRGELQDFVSARQSGNELNRVEMPFIVIEGPSGCGKTHLSIALAHELQATLILVNVLDFLSPHVGASEKLVHDFFSPLLYQYSSGTIKGNGCSPVRCVVTVEGVDCLNENSVYMRSLNYAICSELSRFRDNALWRGECGILFVFTCECLASIPTRIQQICAFSRTFCMRSNTSTTADMQKCFELYLNGRVNLLKRFRELWPAWLEDSGIHSLRPCDIALLCRLATLWSLNRPGMSMQETGVLGRLAGALCTVTR